MNASVPSGLPPLVLASGSRYRAKLLTDAGLVATIDPPGVDERSLDPLFVSLGPEAFALELARRKAAVVARRHPNAVVIAGDQVGVLSKVRSTIQLVKQPDEPSAVAQLMAMSGTTHELLNGLVLHDVGAGRVVEGLDRQRVTMRRFDEHEAREYVRRFEPYDSSGSYRLEDQEQMAPLQPFVTAVDGEDDSGVLGLPLPLLFRLLDDLSS